MTSFSWDHCQLNNISMPMWLKFPLLIITTYSLAGTYEDIKHDKMQCTKSFALKVPFSVIVIMLVLLWQLQISNRLLTSLPWRSHKDKKWIPHYRGLRKRWKKGKCPVPCEVTSDISRADEADAFVGHARDPFCRRNHGIAYYYRIGAMDSADTRKSG